MKKLDRLGADRVECDDIMSRKALSCDRDQSASATPQTLIAQFGEGNFLRAFADLYFEVLNEDGGNYSVSVIKPGEKGNLENFMAQANIYNVVLRGVEDGCATERVYRVTVLKEVFPYYDTQSFYNLAQREELKVIISNTTEAGIYYSDQDTIDDLRGSSYPAKLTAFLYHRFLSGKGGVYILPVELIDDNADRLLECVRLYSALWSLPQSFTEWNESANYYCNTLVDRIVSGYPRGEEERFDSLLGYHDRLLTVGEPFGQWIIENKGDVSKLLPCGRHGTEVIFTDNIAAYKRRKVRVLNGSHTNMVFASLHMGLDTVYQAMQSSATRAFVQNTLDEEIIPFVSDDIADTRAFAASVIERFDNPYINHRLISISLNSVSKWKARVLPSFVDYYRSVGTIPHHMTIGLAYLVHTYHLLTEHDGAYSFVAHGVRYQLVDDKQYLSFFQSGGSVRDFLSADIWGIDLNSFEGLTDTITRYLAVLERGEDLL